MSVLSGYKRRNSELPVIGPETRINNAPDVIETIDNLQIPRNMIIVVGSSALTLLGLDRHAHDVDLVLHPDILNTLSDTHTLPNETPVIETSASHAGFRHFYANTVPLSSEFLSQQPSYSAKSFEDAQQYRTVTGPNEIPLISPVELLLHKLNPVRIGRNQEDRLKKIAQDRYDAGLLRKHISSK